ncbi:Alpha-ketoglutarate-dependent taurine dioxygenase [Candidatus Burkholderia humilis]|nr:Alpha-ketoglutarate-dependent taurine dioxygenase [Candidatus Burkholderia humilis]
MGSESITEALRHRLLSSPDANCEKAVRWSGALGAELSNFDAKDFSDSNYTLLSNYLWQYQVLSIPRQILTSSDMVEIARKFGEVYRYPFGKPLDENPDVFAVTKEIGTKLNFGGVWHSDSPYLRIPPSMTLLYGVDIPTHGGDTLFSDMYGAYDTLSNGMKDMLAGRRVVYSAMYVHGPGTEDLKLGDVVKIRDFELAKKNNYAHPIFRKHPITGKNALYLSRPHVQNFENMTEKESSPIFDLLYTHSIDPVFTSRLAWKKNMLVIFDNRCVQHIAINDYPTERREIYRVIVHDNIPPC